MARGIGGDRGTVALAEAAGAVGGTGAGAPLSAWARRARRGYLALAWLFVACVAVQVFLAGLATFVDAARWRWHTGFVHAFELLPLLMLPLAFLARLPAAMRWLTGALFALLWLQYLTANIGGIAAALHPVNALIIFWVAVHLGQRAWRMVRQEMREPGIAA